MFERRKKTFFLPFALHLFALTNASNASSSILYLLIIYQLVHKTVRAQWKSGVETKRESYGREYKSCSSLEYHHLLHKMQESFTQETDQFNGITTTFLFPVFPFLSLHFFLPSEIQSTTYFLCMMQGKGW